MADWKTAMVSERPVLALASSSPSVSLSSPAFALLLLFELKFSEAELRA